jgi:DNA-binding LytR/AlgR family response regulator
MFRVAICEDEAVFSEAHEKLCRTILDALNIEYSVDLFPNGEVFLSAFEARRERYHVILLDIMMDGINGIELAHTIRGIDKTVAIIFVTSDSGYALKGYDVNALHYLMKPIDNAVLERLLTAIYTERFQSEYITVKMGNQNILVPVSDIIYLETTGRRVKIILRDEAVYYSGKLTDILPDLPQDKFVRCHQSYAVHINHLRELVRYTAVLTNGDKIPVSRKYVSDVQNIFMRFLRER